MFSMRSLTSVAMRAISSTASALEVERARLSVASSAVYCW